MIAPRSARLRVRDCEVDTMRRIVTRDGDGQSLRLTVKSMQVLLALAERRGEVVGRDALFARVWPDTMPTDDVLTQAVTQLRKAFGDDRDAPRYIETIARAGYRLLAEVEWLDGGPGPFTPAGAADAVDATTDEVSADAGATAPDRSRVARAWPWIAAAGAALLALGVLVWPRAAPEATTVAQSTDAVRAPPEVTYRAITSAPGQERLPNLSPDGAMVAFAQAPAEGRGSAILLQDVDRAAARALTVPPPGSSDHLPVWSRDGTRIAFVRTSRGDCRIMVIAASGGDAHEAGQCQRQAYSQFDWTPDGRGLVMGGLRGPDESSAPLQQLDLASGEWRTLQYGIADGDVDLIPRYSPDGHWLAFRRNISFADLWLMPAEGGTPRRLTTLSGDIRGWDWLPDGSGIVFSHVTGDASLFVYSMADGAIRPLPSLPTGNAVHPDVASKAWSMVFEIDQLRSGIFRFRIDGGDAEPVREPVFESSGVDLLPAVSPDGGTLAFYSDRTMSVQLWIGGIGQPATLHPVEGLRPVPRHPPVWSRDGRTLLVIGRTAAGDGLFEVDAGSGSVHALAVPDGSPAFATYAGDAGRLLVGVDAGQGRLRLVLYERAAWRALATLDDVAVARYDPVSGDVYFTRPSKIGLWRADAGLRHAVQVSTAYPAPQHYRHWGLAGGTLHYNGPEAGCAMVWRPLSAARTAAAPCLSRDGVAIAGSPNVDGAGAWLYVGLPMTQNIDIGWAALPVGMQLPR